MEQYRRQALSQGIPCALQHYLFFYSKNAFSSLSKDECASAFRFWVYNFRAVAFEAPTKEQLMCPMLWCRRSFEDQASMMDHTSHCEWLSDAWYWCPDCSRPETFMDCGGTGEHAPRCILQRKDSRVRRAVAFFKHLGHKTSVKGIFPMFSDKAREMADTSRHAPQDAKYTVMEQRPTEIDAGAEVFEMGRCNTISSPSRYELSSHMSQAVKSEVPLQGFTDMHPLEMPAGLSHTIHHELSSSEEHTELLGDLFHHSHRDPETDCSVRQSIVMPPVDEASVTNHVSPVSVTWQSLSQDDVSPITPITEASPSTGESIDSVIGQTPPNKRDQQLFMPNDLIPDAVYSQHKLIGKSVTIPSTDISMVTSRTLPTNHRGFADAVTRQSQTSPIYYLPEDRHGLWTAIVTSGSDTISEYSSSLPSSAPSHEDSSTSNKGSERIEPLIQELSRLVSVINNDWLQRLASSPDLLAFCCNTPVSMLCVHGIDSLKRCLGGKLTLTFTDVFAIMHIACASAYMSNYEDDTYCWADLFVEMLDWRHWITEESEMHLFKRVMSEISGSCGFIARYSGEYDAFIEPPTGSLVEKLKYGLVMESCKAFLKDLDHYRILHRNQQLLPAHLTSYTEMYGATIEDMACHITAPLQHRIGFEAFQMTVADTDFRLRSGLLRDPWEVEVTLLSSCKSYSQSHQLFERYSMAVVRLCDEALLEASHSGLQDWDPNWRDRYYGATLDLCLAILVEIDNRNRSGQKIISSAEGRDDRDMMDGVSLSPKNSSPLALTPSINNDNSDVSPISTASASSLQITPTGFRQSSSTSPTSCTESSLSNSPTSSLTGLQKQCQLCGKRFTGTSRATNLKRHFRFAKIHNSAPNSPRFNCPYPGCGAVLNRSDNLKAHFQALHPRVASFQPKVPSRTLRRRGAKRGRDVECQFDFETIATELE